MVRVRYTNEGIEIEEDNDFIMSGEEMLRGRADVVFNAKGEPEVYSEKSKTLKQGTRRVVKDGKVLVIHTCPVCGKEFEGVPQRKYCSTRCKKTAKMRRYRARKRELKPHRGKAGEVYFVSQPAPNRQVLTFVPALYAVNREKAIEYLKTNFGHDPHLDDYIEQIKEVIKE